MAKTGPKKKPKRLIKEKIIPIRVTNAEFKILSARAKAAELPLGTWLRQLGLDG